MPESTAEMAMRLASERAPFMNFVDFTSTMVREVFRTLVDTSREQLDAYVEMVEAIAGGPGPFIARNIGNLDEAAMKYLNEVVRPTFTTDSADYVRTETNGVVTFVPQDVTLVPAQVPALAQSFDGVRVDVDGDAQPDEITKAITTQGNGSTVPLADLHRFAKAMLERAGRRSFDEMQALLRMGLARVVPNKGFIETAMTFSIDTSETSEKKTSSTDTSSSSNSGSLNFGFEKSSKPGLVASLFSNAVTSKLNVGVSGSTSQTRLRVNVVNEKSTAATNLDIDITGRVRIDFLTDYFPLLPPAAAPQVPAVP